MLSNMLQNLQGLQGLKANQMKMDAVASGQQNRQRATELLRSYQQTQDPAALNEAILLDADLANNVLAGIGIQDKSRMERAATDYIALTGALGNKDQFNRLAAQRLDNILAAGGNPSDTLAVVKAYNEQGPEAAKAMLQPVGAALVNKGVLRPELFAEPKRDELTEYQRQTLALREREARAAEMRASRPDTQVTIDNKQDTEIAKLSAKDYQNLIGRAASANKELATISTLENLSDKAFSGAGAGALLQGAKVLKQLGVETEGLKETEVYEKLANTLVLDKSQQMSGALSNADMTFLQNTVPSLNTSKEGRKLTFEISRKLAEREKQVARLATEFRRNNQGAFDMGEFQAYLDEWKEANPLFEKEAAEQPAQGVELSEEEILLQYGVGE